MEDQRIVDLFFERNEQAVTELQLKYGFAALRTAMNILGQSEDAEEVVNEAYFSVWNSIPPSRPASLGAFLKKITRNKAIDRYRRFVSEKRGGSAFEESLDELGDMVSGKEGPEDSLMAGELAREINLFLHDQPAEKRRIFVMRYFDGEELRTIAEVTGRSEGNIRTILTRLRAALRKQLLAEGYEI